MLLGKGQLIMMFMNTENYPLSWGNFFWIVNNTLSNIWYDIKDNSPVKKNRSPKNGEINKKKKSLNKFLFVSQFLGAFRQWKKDIMYSTLTN